MTPELEAEIRDFFRWFCGEPVPGDDRFVIFEDRGDITYLEVARRINARLKKDPLG